jgi:DHA1 family tetracycline resistance protein-like MFS transporter
MSKQLGPERQGELQGGIASMMGLSSIFGPLALTETMARFSGPNAHPQFPGAAFLLAAGLAALSLFLLTTLLEKGESARS